MTKKRSKNRKPPDEEYHLQARIKQCVTSSYYISASDDVSNDEAILDFLAEIIEVTPKMPQYVGVDINCSLMSARTYRANNNGLSLGNPLLLYMRLSRDIRLFSAYLPSDVFWALSSDLKDGRLKHVEAWFDKPRYGSGKLRSLYFSEEPDPE